MKVFFTRIRNFSKRFQKLFRNLFSRKKSKTQEDKSSKIKHPRGLKRELSDLKEKLTNFLVTYSVNSGMVIETNNYKLMKNASNLYKLEGTEKSGRTYSIIISTNDIITDKKGNLTGLIRVSEAELNRALQYNYTSLGKFIENFPRLNLNEKSHQALYKEKNTSDWKEILQWSRFWQEQLILKLSPNVLAILLVILDMDFYDFFEKVATDKQKKILVDELFFLNQQVKSDEGNPYTKNLGLIHFESAEDEFKQIYLQIKEKMQKESAS